MGMVSSDVTLGLAAALVAAMLTYAFCQIAIRQRLVLDEVSARSNHQIPTPRLGGAGVMIGFAAAAAIMMGASLISSEMIPLIMLTFAAGIIGLADDLTTVSAGAKLLMLAVLSGFAAVVLGPVSQVPIPFVGWVELSPNMGMALGAFWLLAIVNVVNFMDGLNGLIGTAVVLVVVNMGLIMGGELGWLVLAVEAGVIGFLACNAFSGRIFLGDAGSLSLGFLLGALPLVADGEGRVFWLTPLVALPLIADVAVTLVVRARRGAALAEPHREHLYQRLKAAGWSHQAVSLGLGAVIVLGAFMSRNLGPEVNVTPSAYWGSAIGLAAVWAVVMLVMRTLKPPHEDEPA
ncbi:MAG: hypothetical protein AAFR65_03620 [Pseudomonadota bacterium]